MKTSLFATIKIEALLSKVCRSMRNDVVVFGPTTPLFLFVAAFLSGRLIRFACMVTPTGDQASFWKSQAWCCFNHLA